MTVTGSGRTEWGNPYNKPYKPVVRFARMAYERMMALVHACDIEVSGLGVTATAAQRAIRGVKEEIYITEIHIAEQDCTGATTDLRASALGELLMRQRDKNKEFDALRMNVWWHSHVNMEASPSGKDWQTFNEFDFDEYGIMIIANKTGNVFARVQVYKPFPYVFDGCNVVIDPSSIVPDGWADDQIKKYVFTRSPEFRNVTPTAASPYLHNKWQPKKKYKQQPKGHPASAAEWQKEALGLVPSRVAEDDKPRNFFEDDDTVLGYGGFPITLELFNTDYMDPTMSQADLLFLANERLEGRLPSDKLAKYLSQSNTHEGDN